MKKVGHTPGPWFRPPHINSANPRFAIAAMRGADAWEIATVVSWLGDHSDEPSSNADLLAAAPTMLAALVAAEEDLDDVPGKKPPPSLAIVRAAIAAARGGA